MGQAADYTRKPRNSPPSASNSSSRPRRSPPCCLTSSPSWPSWGSGYRAQRHPTRTLIDTDPQGYLRQFAAYQAATAEQQPPRNADPTPAASLRALDEPAG